MAIATYFGGGEDDTLFQMGGAGITTTSTRFRSTYARCALTTLGLSTLQGDNYWQNSVPFAQTYFWFGARTVTFTSAFAIANPMIDFLDASGVVRLRLRGAGGGFSSLWRVDKMDSVGAITQLGSNFTMTVSGTTVDRIAAEVYYNTSGIFRLYLNGILQFSYSGDVTTDAVTELASFRVRCETTTGLGNTRCWSEIVISDSDTRSMSLQTFPPVANGTTHNFDTGAPAAINVNEIVLNDATIDGSSAAGQIDEYTIGALATGTFSILSVGVTARAQAGGAGGPQNIDMAVRSGGTDYFSGDMALDVAFGGFQYWWDVDPDTTDLWAALPTNIGVRSAT